MSSTYITIPSGGSSGGGDVNIFDSAGNPLTSTAGALNVSGTSTVSGTVNTNLNGLTEFQTSHTTVGVSAVQLDVTPLAGRSSVSIKAITSSSLNIIYIGNSSGVTTATGFPLYQGDTIQLDVTDAAQIWAISNAASQTACIVELGS